MCTAAKSVAETFAGEVLHELMFLAGKVVFEALGSIQVHTVFGCGNKIGFGAIPEFCSPTANGIKLFQSHNERVDLIVTTCTPGIGTVKLQLLPNAAAFVIGFILGD